MVNFKEKQLQVLIVMKLHSKAKLSLTLFVTWSILYLLIPNMGNAKYARHIDRI